MLFRVNINNIMKRCTPVGSLVCGGEIALDLTGVIG